MEIVFLLLLFLSVYCTFFSKFTTILSMKAMKLHLFTTTQYTCIPETETLFDPERGLRRLKQLAQEASVPLIDEELAVFTTQEAVLTEGKNSLAIGAGPAEGPVDVPPFHTRDLAEGPYYFYQFADSSEQGIRGALQYSLQALKQKGFIPSSDQVILRGVKEAGFYVLQIVIPLED